MIILTTCGGRIITICPCGYRASGFQPLTVADAMKARESFAHGRGMSAETHALLRMDVALRAGAAAWLLAQRLNATLKSLTVRDHSLIARLRWLLTGR